MYTITACSRLSKIGMQVFSLTILISFGIGESCVWSLALGSHLMKLPKKRMHLTTAVKTLGAQVARSAIKTTIVVRLGIQIILTKCAKGGCQRLVYPYYMLCQRKQFGNSFLGHFFVAAASGNIKVSRLTVISNTLALAWFKDSFYQNMKKLHLDRILDQNLLT